MNGDTESVQIVRIQSDWTESTLKDAIDTLARVTSERFIDAERTNVARFNGIEERFKHMEAMFKLGQEAAQTAVNKAEAAQHAHNVSANEWRGTLNDFKSTLIGRPEFERFYAEFAAYRLANATVAGAQQGQREASREIKDDWKAYVGWAVAVIVAVLAYMVKH